MHGLKKTIQLGVVTSFLLGGVTANTWGQVGGGGGLGRDMGEGVSGFVRIVGQVMCSDCTLQEAEAVYPDMVDFYQLSFNDGELAVMQVHSVNVEDPDRLEYEIVKGQQTYEIHIDIDEEENTATDIFIHRNRNRSADTRRFLKLQDGQE
jgi:hypothetical protein